MGLAPIQVESAVERLEVNMVARHQSGKQEKMR